MSVSRLAHITPIGVEQMGALADQLRDPQVLRLENLDTDLRPPATAIEVTRRAVDDDPANSYLPFLGRDVMREAAAALVGRQSGQAYDWRTECVISAGGLSGILNVLLATLEPGDEVLLTDPIYSGLINRVRLAQGVPRFVPLIPSPGGWRLDVRSLAAIDPTRVKVAIVTNPSMPTGAVLNHEEWEALLGFCRDADCWVLYNAAMERILYDGRRVVHPASFPGMRDKVITVGAASKEYRMIGWRVGWTVGPAPIVADIARVAIANVVTPVGIAMEAVAAAIRTGADDGDADIRRCVEEWQRRRDAVLEELRDFTVIPPHGGWSCLLDVSPSGCDGATAAARLLEIAKVAVTPMGNWGQTAASPYVRLVFANEPVPRLRGLGERVRQALHDASPA
jgi:N-succinyldiaminopimelate aminotransferase